MWIQIGLPGSGSRRLGLGLGWCLVLGLGFTACAASNPRYSDGGPGGDTAVGPDAGLCGNGALDPGEACDDGNTVSGDGCSAACREERCDPQSCATGCCDPGGQCRGGNQDLACGSGGGSCVDCTASGFLCQSGQCEDPGACSPGDTLPCGDCGERTCAQNGAWGSCEGQGACAAGQVDVTGACGNCGELSRVCQSDCTWGGLECLNEGTCVPGTVEQGQSCGTCSVEERTCDAATCTWGAWVCVSYQECTPGAVDSGAGCGNCGHQERSCQTDCTWDTWQCVDEGVCAVGTTTSTGCTCGEKTCNAACTWGNCVTFAEQCNGQDDDCNGVCDNGFACCQGDSESCTTGCGSTGTRTCSSGCTWGGCQAPAETCNGVDDDCDGTADEGWRAAIVSVSYSTLSGYASGCNGSQTSGQACNEAIHEWCNAQGCENSGFGPVEVNVDAYVTCVAGADVRTVTWSTLQSHQAACSSGTPISDTCYSAYNRYCTSQGYDGGFGPIYATGSNATIACITGGTDYNTTYTNLSQNHHPDCDNDPEYLGQNCNAAIKRYCVSQGHTSGFGPVEHVGDNLNVVCLDP